MAFRHKMAIAAMLGLLTDEDKPLSEPELFVTFFRRAAEGRKLAQLWHETERCHEASGQPNPFEGQ